MTEKTNPFDPAVEHLSPELQARAEKVGPYNQPASDLQDVLDLVDDTRHVTQKILDDAGMSLTDGTRLVPRRDSWDVYFLKIAALVATRATCDRAHIGCVLVRNNNIISSGYNGSIRGLPHCDDVGHLMENDHCVRTVHDAQNAVAQAARYGKATDGATAYVSGFPCWICFKLLANAGIISVIYSAPYRNDQKVIDAAQQAGIELRYVKV